MSDVAVQPIRQFRQPKASAVQRYEPPHPIVLLLLFVAVSLVSRASVLRVPILNIDEASYIVGSWEMFRGHLPYLDFADNKPPLVYLYYWFAQLLFGRGMVAVRLLTAAAVVPLTAAAASAFFRHTWRGVIAALIFLTYSAAYLAHDVLAVNCELLMALPLAWALVCVRDVQAISRLWRICAAGSLVGIATLVKYQAAFWLPAIGCAIALAERRSGFGRQLGILAIGFMAPLGAAYLWFRTHGAGDAFVYWNLTHNLAYALAPIGPTQAAERIGAYLLPFLAVTSLLWVAWCRSVVLFGSRYQVALIAGLIVLSMVAAAVGLRFFPHYFVQLYVPLALGAAPWTTDRLLSREEGWRKTVLIGYSLAPLAAFTVINPVLYSSRLQVYNETSIVFRDVTRWLRNDRCYDGGSLFVWGYAPLFYYHSGLPIASRFFFPEFPLVEYTAGSHVDSVGRLKHIFPGEQEWEWLMSDLLRNRPTYVIDTGRADIFAWRYSIEEFPRLQRLMQREYGLVGEVDRVRIYRRLDCRRTQPATILNHVRR